MKQPPHDTNRGSLFSTQARVRRPSRRIAAIAGTGSLAAVLMAGCTGEPEQAAEPDLFVGFGNSVPEGSGLAAPADDPGRLVLSLQQIEDNGAVYDVYRSPTLDGRSPLTFQIRSNPTGGSTAVPVVESSVSIRMGAPLITSIELLLGGQPQEFTLDSNGLTANEEWYGNNPEPDGQLWTASTSCDSLPRSSALPVELTVVTEDGRTFTASDSLNTFSTRVSCEPNHEL